MADIDIPHSDSCLTSPDEMLSDAGASLAITPHSKYYITDELVTLLVSVYDRPILESF